MAIFGISKNFLHTYVFLVKIKDSKAWLLLSNKMARCYLLVNVQEIRIQPYFRIKQDDYFFSLFLGHPVCMYVCIRMVCRTPQEMYHQKSLS